MFNFLALTYRLSDKAAFFLVPYGHSHIRLTVTTTH